MVTIINDQKQDVINQSMDLLMGQERKSHISFRLRVLKQKFEELHLFGIDVVGFIQELEISYKTCIEIESFLKGNNLATEIDSQTLDKYRQRILEVKRLEQVYGKTVAELYLYYLQIKKRINTVYSYHN